MTHRISIERLQSALFLGSIDLSDKVSAASHINASAGGVFDGDPTLLPVPADAAAEIPRIILKNKQDTLFAAISHARADFGLSKLILLEESGKEIRTFLDLLQRCVNPLKDRLHAVVTRLGWAVAHLVELDSSASDVFLARWLKHSAFPRLYEGTLQYIAREKVDGVDVNEVVQITTARDVANPLKDTLMRVVLDINTVPEKRLDLNAREVFDLAQSMTKVVGGLIGRALPENL